MLDPLTAFLLTASLMLIVVLCVCLYICSGGRADTNDTWSAAAHTRTTPYPSWAPRVSYPNTGVYAASGALYPPGGAAYPPGGAPYPPGGAPYPPGGTPYPPGSPPYPIAGASYLASDEPYSPGGPPYPVTGVPFASGTRVPVSNATYLAGVPPPGWNLQGMPPS